MESSIFGGELPAGVFTASLGPVHLTISLLSQAWGRGTVEEWNAWDNLCLGKGQCQWQVLKLLLLTSFNLWGA